MPVRMHETTRQLGMPGCTGCDDTTPARLLPLPAVAGFTNYSCDAQTGDYKLIGWLMNGTDMQTGKHAGAPLDADLPPLPCLCSDMLLVSQATAVRPHLEGFLFLLLLRQAIPTLQPASAARTCPHMSPRMPATALCWGQCPSFVRQALPTCPGESTL